MNHDTYVELPDNSLCIKDSGDIEWFNSNDGIRWTGLVKIECQDKAVFRIVPVEGPLHVSTDAAAQNYWLECNYDTATFCLRSSSLEYAFLEAELLWTNSIRAYWMEVLEEAKSGRMSLLDMEAICSGYYKRHRDRYN